MVVVGGRVAVRLEREGVDDPDAAGGEIGEREIEQRRGDAVASPRGGDDEADDDRRIVRRNVDRRRRDAHPLERVRELVPRLRVQPPDHRAVRAGEVASRLPAVDRGADRDAVLRGRERRPVDRPRQTVELAVAARPVGVVGERRAALVIEERQVVVAVGRTQARDGDRCGRDHADMIAPPAPRRTSRRGTRSEALRRVSGP
mgnify:CR=1 FL=1